MIGGIGLAIDFNAADPTAQILRREDKVATIRAISPLRMIVQPAGRRPRLVGVTAIPCVAIVQSGPRRLLNQPVLRIRYVEVEIATQQARRHQDLTSVRLVVSGNRRCRAGRRFLLEIQQPIDLRFALAGESDTRDAC